MQLPDFARDNGVDIAVEGISGPDMKYGGAVEAGRCLVADLMTCPEKRRGVPELAVGSKEDRRHADKHIVGVQSFPVDGITQFWR
jgi:hypothetical protein